MEWNIHPKIAKLGKFFFLSFLIGVIAVGTFIALVMYGYFGKLPTSSELKLVRNSEATEVYSADGVMMGKYFIQNRTNIEYDDISPEIINALVATEDVRFYQHSGIDTKSLGRVLIKTLLMQKESSGGGSTISQQLAKNLFPRTNHGMLTLPVNKVREMIIASRLEKIYSKEDILTLYLNTVPLGGNVFGIQAACKRFFNTTAKDIGLEDAAVLVGMLKATTAYNPRLYPEAATSRRNVVLDQMVKYGLLMCEDGDSLKQEPISLQYSHENHHEGLAPYFREKLRGELKKWCKENTKPDGTPYNLYADGLRIYTSIHAGMQRYAEEAVSERMAELQKDFYKHWRNGDPWGKDFNVVLQARERSQRYKNLKKRNASKEEIDLVMNKPIKMEIFDWEGEKMVELSPMDSIKHYARFLHTGFMAMEPETGLIRAWVGGINHKYFQYDHITSNRQVGSTFKPFVYATALEEDIHPCQYFDNEWRQYADYEGWAPRNSDEAYGGAYSMQGGLAKSINTISAQLILETGPKKVVDLAKRMGIDANLPAVPAISLGAANISLQEMVEAYCVFANGGKRIKPLYIVRIEDKNGKVLVDFNKDNTGESVLSNDIAKIMVKMMQSVVDSGTGQRVRNWYGLPGDIAGKTGTTQNQADGWFMGFTPKLVAGVWVGAEDQRVRFNSLYLGQGANTALPIWGKFMRKVYKDESLRKIVYTKFPAMSDSLKYALDCPFFLNEEPVAALEDLIQIRSLDELKGLAPPVISIDALDATQNAINQMMPSKNGGLPPQFKSMDELKRKVKVSLHNKQ